MAFMVSLSRLSFTPKSLNVSVPTFFFKTFFTPEATSVFSPRTTSGYLPLKRFSSVCLKPLSTSVFTKSYSLWNPERKHISHFSLKTDGSSLVEVTIETRSANKPVARIFSIIFSTALRSELLRLSERYARCVFIPRSPRFLFFLRRRKALPYVRPC